MNMNKNPKEIIIAGGGWKSPEHARLDLWGQVSWIVGILAISGGFFFDQGIIQLVLWGAGCVVLCIGALLRVKLYRENRHKTGKKLYRPEIE